MQICLFVDSLAEKPAWLEVEKSAALSPRIPSNPRFWRRWNPIGSSFSFSLLADPLLIFFLTPLDLLLPWTNLTVFSNLHIHVWFSFQESELIKTKYLWFVGN